MAKLLIVDDEAPMRQLLRLNLMETYEIVDTGEPDRGLALALEHKPDAILLDLRMPRYSGFELCRTLTSFSGTQLIPVFVISGEAGARTKELCRDLGAVAYFEKPVDFEGLRRSLEQHLAQRRRERREETRVRLRVPLKLSGLDTHGGRFSLLSASENIGRNSFFCACETSLAADALVSVHLVGKGELQAGQARVVRAERSETVYPSYAFRFVEKPQNWLLE
jgi:DNA-binding response OmpR family regulator